MEDNIPEASVQSDSQKEAVSDSDSGDSLFLTQSVTSALRTVKRRRPSPTQACPFSQESEDEQDRDSNPNTQHEVPSDSDSEPSYADLLHRWKSHNRIGSQPRRRHKRMPQKRVVLPFLKTSGSGQFPGHKHKAVANSEIGGFFKCILKLSKGHGERRRELSPSLVHSDQHENEEEDENVEENEDNEDIRKVNRDCFILGAHKRNRQTWLPFLKWKTRQTPRKCTEKSNNGQEEREKCFEAKKVTEDLMEPQDDSDIHNKSSSFNIEASQSRKNGEKSRKSARTSLLPRSPPSHILPDKSPFVQSLFMDHQEEHSENQPQVLVTCSQSQSLEDETQILEDNPTDSDGGEETLCSENISFHEHQVQEEDIHEGVHCEPVENIDLDSVSEGFICSQDLFQEPNNQASSLKETSVENNNEVLESCVILHDGIDSVMKKKRSSLILADVEMDHVTYSKSQPTQATERISPTAGDVWQERKENGKKILDDGEEHGCPSLPLDDYTSGSRGNDFSSPSKGVLMARQEEKTETPLFMYGGLKFLKRKKGKKTEALEISDNPDQKEGSAPHVDDMVKQRKRKKMKKDRLLEEPVDTLPEISVPADLSLSFQDYSVDGAAEIGIKPRQKRKKDKNYGLLEESGDTLREINVHADSSLSFQDSSMASASVGGNKPKKKRKKDKHHQPVPQEDQWIGVEEAIQIPCQSSDLPVSIETEQLVRTDLSSPSISHKVKQLDSNTQVNKDLVQAGGLEPQRKKKNEVKKWDSSPIMSNEMVAPQCSEESHSRHGAKTVKKKKQQFIDYVGDMPTASKDLEEPLDKILEIPAGLEIQEDSVSSRKKKKRKRQEEARDNIVNVEESLVETTEQVEIPNGFQDSGQKAAEVVKVRKKKKDRTETHEEEEASKNAPMALGRGLGDMTTSGTPGTRSETGGIGEEEALGGSEQVKKKKKKKKKKRKEIENDGFLSVSNDLVYSHNTEQTTAVEEASSSVQNLGKRITAPCLEMQLTNGSDEKKECDGTIGDGSECSQQIPQSEDTIQPKGKKKKKKKKKRKEIENDGFLSVSHDLVYSHNTEQTTAVEEASSSVQNLGKGITAPCLEMQLTNGSDEKKECDGTIGDGSECSQQIPQSEDTIQPKGKKKKKKKRKEIENDGFLSVSNDLVYSHNTEQTTAVEEASSSVQNLGKGITAPCLEMQLTNGSDEKKECDGTNGDGSECRQQIPQAEDAMHPKRKKKKKKRKKKRKKEKLVGTDLEVYPEIVEHDMCLKIGSPSESSEAIIGKKKKNRKDTVDTGENGSLGVQPELSAAEEPRDVLVTCYAKEDSISSSGIKKKKQVKDLDNDLKHIIGTKKS